MDKTTRAKIVELFNEAYAAGDFEQIALCQQALGGCEAAAEDCLSVIDDAAAMDDSGDDIDDGADDGADDDEPEYGWCHACHNQGYVLAGHFACSVPRKGLIPSHLENGSWVMTEDNTEYAREDMVVYLSNAEGNQVIAHVSGPGALAWARREESIRGDGWESDGSPGGNFAYAIFDNEPGLIAELAAEGYRLNTDQFDPMDDDEDEDAEDGEDDIEMVVHLDNLDREGDVLAYVSGPGAAVWAEHDQSIQGSRWETDGEDFAYAIVIDEPALESTLESEGYSLDTSEYCPPD